MLANVKQKTIEPFIKETIAPGTRVYTDEYSIYARYVSGDTTISMWTMDEESTPEMKMATAFVKSMCIPWKGFGLSCGVGFAPIGAFHKKNSPFTSVSSSLCTMPETEAKRCFMRSLSYWSN